MNRLSFFAFAFCAAAWLTALLENSTPPAGDWATIVLLSMAAAATLLNLSRSLPAQNVLAAVLVIVIVSDLAQLAGIRSGCFVAPLSYINPSGPKSFNPWLTPLAWVVAVLNSRGVARLVLRPWRSSHNYGLWAIAVTCALVFMLDACLDLADWHIDDWRAAAACIVSTLAIVVLAVPWLINKRPGPQPPPDWQPFMIWQILNVLLAFAEAAQHAPSAAVFHITVGAVIAIAALRANSRRPAVASSQSSARS